MLNQEPKEKLEPIRFAHYESRYRSGYDASGINNGFCLKTEIILWPDGFFHYKTVHKYFKGNGSSHSASEELQSGQWRWKTQGDDEAFLVLEFENNNQLRLNISYRDQKGLLLDGKRFYVEKDHMGPVNAGTI